MSSSASLKHSSSRPGRPLFGQVLLKNLSNKDTCHEFLSHCTNYGKNMQAWRHFCVTLFASRVGAPSDLKERITRLRSEVTDVSTEAASAQGVSFYR
ncbi:hypothetical protein BJV77DRAFT_601305 [Russula vinacea]|nr:hypothetical protein BJV77DRAFT_601305 [Russula vinacea]